MMKPSASKFSLVLTLLALLGLLTPAALAQANPVFTLGGGNSWTTVAPMPTARTGLAAVTGSDGNIYAIGGLDGTQVLPTVECYHPVTDTWTTVAPMPTARAYLAAVLGVDRWGRNLIYVIGGYDRYGVPLNTVEAYDPVTDTWITGLPPMPTARYSLAAAIGDNYGAKGIFAMGGYNQGYLSTVEVYDPYNNFWAPNPSMPTARGVLGAAAWGGGTSKGYIYALGGSARGYHGREFSLDTVEAYDLDISTWASSTLGQLQPMPSDRAGLATVTGSDGNGGKLIYAIGGASYFDLILYLLLDTIETYDPDTDTWVSSALGQLCPMPTVRTDLAAATGVGVDGIERIYAIGGSGYGGVLNTVEAYTP